MTGIDDPYEAPTDAEIVIDTEQTSIGDAVEQIVGYLKQNGYIASSE
jgi:sulfate adenylyltransferase